MRMPALLVAVAAAGCSGDKTHAVAARELGTLGLVADLAEPDRVIPYMDGGGTRIVLSDRQSGDARNPYGVFLTACDVREKPCTLAEEQAQLDRDLGIGIVEYPRQDTIDGGWHLEYRQMQPESAQVGVTIVKTIGGTKWHCHGYTYVPSQLRELRDVCRSVRGK